jgi:hypothetical protein
LGLRNHLPESTVCRDQSAALGVARASGFRSCRRQLLSDHGVVRHISFRRFERYDAGRTNAGHSDRFGPVPPAFPPDTPTLKVVALGGAIFRRILGRGDPKLRAAAIVLAALSTPEYWGHIVF